MFYAKRNDDERHRTDERRTCQGLRQADRTGPGAPRGERPERLERHGRAAAQQSQAIEAEQSGQGVELDASQKVELNEINGQQAKALAKELNRDNENGDQVKQARAREIAERFKEKAARDREQERGFSR